PSSEKGLKRLTATDFEEVFNDTLSQYVKRKIKEYDFCYYDLTPSERDAWIRKIVDVLIAPNIEEVGEHRLEQWEKGWEQNLAELEASSKVEAIIPGYYGKYNVLRWKQEFIKPAHKDFEYYSHAIIQDWLFDKYMRNAATVYEFGCGTGHNLFRVRDVNPKAKIWGLDWATSSQKIIQKLARDGVDRNFFAHRFDFFNPDENFNLIKSFWNTCSGRNRLFAYILNQSLSFSTKTIFWITYQFNILKKENICQDI
ncbi:unnamed protein product, partial [marine sediment metagenome]